MAIASIFLAAWACVLLQFWSRNFIFILVALGCCLTMGALLLCRKTKCWLWVVPSIVTNALMLPSIVQAHIEHGDIIRDYLICTIIMALTIVVSIIEVIPTKRKRPAT